MLDRLTERAKTALMKAQEMSRELGHGYIGSEHVLYGVAAVDGLTKDLLAGSGITAEMVFNYIHQHVGRRTQVSNMPTNAIAMTPRTKRLLDGSVEMATSMGHNYVGPEHILIALLMEKEGIAFQIITAAGANVEKLKLDLFDGLSASSDSESSPGPNGPGGGSTRLLDQYGRDLTKMAQEGRLDPVIGRQEEMERILEILSRRIKNNPVLIGEPGVGKTAVVEGLAQRIVQGNIPELLQGKRVVTLDMSAMLAGAK